MEVLQPIEQVRRLSRLSANAETWERGRVAELRLKSQTSHLVALLEAGGYVAERPMSSDIVRVGVCSGKAEVLPSYRNINFLPSIARAKRQKMVRNLSWWADQGRGYLRYGVVTGGARVPISQLRESLMHLGRLVSRWSASDQLRAWGVSVVFRASEFTINSDKLCHPHLNLVYDFTRRLEPQEFAQFLKFTREFFGAVWKDCGRLVDPAEVVKYVVKPTDLDGLGSADLVALANSLFGLRLVSTFGAFRVAMQRLKLANQSIAKTWRGESWRWCIIQRSPVVRGESGRASAGVDQILAVTSPAPSFGPRFEPSVLVRNWSGRALSEILGESLSAFLLPAVQSWLDVACEEQALNLTLPPQLSEEIFESSIYEAQAQISETHQPSPYKNLPLWV
jgi:hypothetical protein